MQVFKSLLGRHGATILMAALVAVAVMLTTRTDWQSSSVSVSASSFGP